MIAPVLARMVAGINNPACKREFRELMAYVKATDDAALAGCFSHRRAVRAARSRLAKIAAEHITYLNRVERKAT